MVASSTWPDGSPRTVDDNEYEILGAAWSTDGIVGSPADTAVVYADASGMQVKIRAGKYAVVHGKGWYSGPSEMTKSISANASGQTRVDLLVLGLDRSTQLVTEYIKVGTPGTVPVPPALQRDAAGAGTGKWEIPLARIIVGPGTASIGAGNLYTTYPYIGNGHLILPNTDALNRIATPTSGTIAVVGGDTWLYTAANGWRPAAWGTAWGIIGGQEYAATGAATGAGIGSTELPLNISSGAVSLTTGRRYQARAHFRHTHASSGSLGVFYIKEGSTSGTQRACYVAGPMNSGVGYERWIFGEWTETAGSVRTFVLTGYAVSASMSIFRTIAAGELAGVFIHDQGPAGNTAGPV